MGSKRILMVVAAAALAAGLMASPAHAKPKCSKSCHQTIISTFHSCKKSCPKKKAGLDCRRACVDTKNAAVTKCHAATAPACSPSGAFVE